MRENLARDAPDLLLRIAKQRRRRLEEVDRSAGREWRRPASLGRRDFVAALKARQGHAVIAEIKMGSPRLGSLVGRIDPRSQAELYRKHGAAALSVVVEPDFFQGSYELLSRCREVAGLPAIAKDFLVHRRQIELAEQAGADALLLVAALYGKEDLHRWAEQVEEAGLTPLVETHDSADVAKLAGRAWPLVGVNNRDLRTFEVSLRHSIELAPSLPGGAVKVAESGISTSGDVAELRNGGFDAFLVGESLLLAEDPARLMRELAA